MANTLTFYKISDDPLVIDKTLGTAVKTLTSVKIKDSTDILNPIFILRYDASIFTANYVYFDDFARWYFIENIEVENERIFVYCKVDVLYTYATGIKNTTAFIERQGATTKADSLLPDPLVPIKSNNRIYLDGDGDVESTVAAKWSRVTDDRDGDFVMLIGGGQINIGG